MCVAVDIIKCKSILENLYMYIYIYLSKRKVNIDFLKNNICIISAFIITLFCENRNSLTETIYFCETGGILMKINFDAILWNAQELRGSEILDFMVMYVYRIYTFRCTRNFAAFTAVRMV